MRFDRDMWNTVKEFFNDIHDISCSLKEIVKIQQSEDLPISFTMSQISFHGGHMAGITPGVAAGGQGTFGIVGITPSTAQFPAGTAFTWSVDDAADVTLTPSQDTTTCVAAVAAGDQAPAFTLTMTSNFTPQGASAPLASSLTVPVSGEVPPVVTPSAFELGQIA